MMTRTIMMLLSFMLISILPATAEMVSRIAAVVNDDIITTYQLDQALQLQLATMDRRPTPAQLTPLRNQVLKRLIEETLVQQRIRALNLTVSEEEVETAILDVQKQNNLTREQLADAVLTQGMTFDAYRDNLRKQILRYKLISTEVRSQVDVTEKEVLEYYRAHIDEYRYPSSVTLSAITFPIPEGSDKLQKARISQAAESAYDRLINGSSFEETADFYSDKLNAFSASLGTFSYGEMVPEFVNAINDVPDGRFSRPVEKADAVHILRVDDRQEGGLRQYDVVKPEIYQLILDQKTDARIKQWTKGLESRAFIDIRL
ncbi:MAG: SurA N-terminal domain-containing protein [Deltaproteobacteria bacterium]|jgi:peptidyl-prolyl cis-trans isomerase SurA|nr:SurA N-terminal domain-containing protein [Deltaproteobacteria bacterium]